MTSRRPRTSSSYYALLSIVRYLKAIDLLLYRYSFSTRSVLLCLLRRYVTPFLLSFLSLASTN
jgi:hypothetical protein